MSMRVLQLHTRYRQAGGEDAVVAGEADLLRAAGHEVRQVRARNPEGRVESLTSLAGSTWSLRARAAIRALTERWRPDIAHIHNTWFAMTPSVLAGLDEAHVPIVVTLHNYRLVCAAATLFRDGRPCQDCVGTHPWHGVRHACYRGSRLQTVPAATSIAVHEQRGTWRRHPDLLLVLNDFARSVFIASGLPAELLRVKANFVPDPGPRSMPVSASNEILVVGRLSTEKGVDVVLEAWRRLGSTDLKLVVIGDGPLRSELERSAPEGVTFTGLLPPESVRARMLAARALALPSLWYEGQPMTVIEALSCGVPALVSDHGGLPQLVGSVDPSLAITPGDIDAWATALRRLADRRDLDVVSARARSAWQREFSPAVALSALTDAYAAAIERAGLGTS